jgi:hypothetical protein
MHKSTSKEKVETLAKSFEKKFHVIIKNIYTNCMRKSAGEGQLDILHPKPNTHCSEICCEE